MFEPRIWYKYLFKVGNRIVHGGITTDLKQRYYHHRCRWPSGHIVQVGRRTTKTAALRWERENGFQANSPI